MAHRPDAHAFASTRKIFPETYIAAPRQPLFLAMWSQRLSRVLWLTLKNPSEVVDVMIL
jgi:hypothetical protein